VSLLSKKFTFTTTARAAARPHTAVELTPEGALAAAIPNGATAPVYAFAPLRPGALSPGISGTNIMTHDAVVETLRTALDQVSPRSRAVTLIVPDTAARVFVLDFDTLPPKAPDVIYPVLRFRLRKMVPFEVEHAALSYQILSQNPGGGEGSVKVLVTIMPKTILAEYESVVVAAGYEPGVVLLSSLASLAALAEPAPALAANLSSTALTTSITSGDDLLLYRTLELPEDNATRVADVQRNIAVAAAYFEDKVGSAPHQLHYAGAVPAHEFARAISDTGLNVVETTPTPSTGAVTTLGPIGFAGVSGALAGVA
jgi:type IV pilus assembly protein PilM